MNSPPRTTGIPARGRDRAKPSLKERITMNTERIREPARNPEHIPGIYNRCDRWCERCPEQSKCLVFAMEQEPAASARADEDGSSFLGVVDESLDLAHELLIEAMREEGLDPEEALAEAEPDPIENRCEQRRSHPLVEQARQYARQAGPHLDALSDALGFSRTIG